MHSVTCDKALFVSIKYEYNALDFSSKWHLVAAEPNRGICIGLPPVTERNYNLMARLEDDNKNFSNRVVGLNLLRKKERW